MHDLCRAWSHHYSWDTQLRAPLANKDRSAKPMVPIIEVAISFQVNYATMSYVLYNIRRKEIKWQKRMRW